MSFIGKFLKVIPGIGNIVSAVEAIGDIAGAIGGETGKKIQDGISGVTEGLQEAEAQGKLTAEQQYDLKRAGLAHKARMRELEVEDNRIDADDADSARGFAAQELQSEDPYIRRTRPRIVRLYAWATVLIALVILFAVVLVICSTNTITETEAKLLDSIAMYVLATVGGGFAAAFRIYTTKRSQDKMVAAGMQPTTLMENLGKMVTGGGVK